MKYIKGDIMTVISIALASVIVIIILCMSPLGSTIVSTLFMLITFILFIFGIYAVACSQYILGLLCLILTVVCYGLAVFIYNLYSWSMHYLEG